MPERVGVHPVQQNRHKLTVNKHVLVEKTGAELKKSHRVDRKTADKKVIINRRDDKAKHTKGKARDSIIYRIPGKAKRGKKMKAHGAKKNNTKNGVHNKRDNT